MRKQSRITRTDEHEGRDGYWKGEADDNRKRQAKKKKKKKSAKKKAKKILKSKDVSDEPEENEQL
jgi:hypothetical protein